MYLSDSLKKLPIPLTTDHIPRQNELLRIGQPGSYVYYKVCYVMMNVNYSVIDIYAELVNEPDLTKWI